MRVKNRMFDEGFLLIEVICSIALLSFFILFLAHYYTTMLVTQNNNVRHLEALSLAQDTIEQWLLINDQAPTSFGSFKKGIFNVSTEKISPDQLSFQAKQKIAFSLLKVIVSWQTLTGDCKEIELCAGKING